MAPVIAVHRAAMALFVVMIALSVLAREDPEMLLLLVMICTQPELVIGGLLMIAIAMPEVPTSPAR